MPKSRMGRQWPSASAVLVVALVVAVPVLMLPTLLPLWSAAPEMNESGTEPRGLQAAERTSAKRQPAAAPADHTAQDGDKVAANDLPPGQRVLRKVQARQAAIQALTVRGESIDDAPPFTVTSREGRLEFFPCDDCHEGEPNTNVRVLEDEHEDLSLQHGGGRYWCYDACHTPGKMNVLSSLRGEPIPFNKAYLLCGQCHFQRQKDWYFGGHGKRAGAWENPRQIPVTYDELLVEDRESIGTWQGERVIHNCTDCHNAHSPSIKPFKPSPPPQARSGLIRRTVPALKFLRIWEEGAQH